MIDLVTIVVGSIITLWLGSIEWRLRDMNNSLKDCVDQTFVKEIIDMKQESLRSEQKDIKEDLKRVEAKIDRLIDLQLSRK